MILRIAGLILLLLVLREVFQTVIVPRSKVARFLLGPLFVRNLLWPPFRFAASRLKSPAWRAEVLGMFAPFVLMLMLAIWISSLILAFSLISISISTDFKPPLDSLQTAVYFAGSSVLTLGSSEYSGTSTAARMLILSAAFTGVVLTASVVSLMFTLIGAIREREILVSITTNVAGAPPSGLAILETYATMKAEEGLEDFYNDWHKWCADVFESHQAYSLLPYFRSNDPLTSWLTALGAVLDSSAMLISVAPEIDCTSTKLFYRFGCRLVDRLARHWNLPQHTKELSKEEFQAIYKRLLAAGYCTQNEDAAYQSYIAFRSNYFPALETLYQHLILPSANP